MCAVSLFLIMSQMLTKLNLGTTPNQILNDSKLTLSRHFGKGQNQINMDTELRFARNNLQTRLPNLKFICFFKTTLKHLLEILPGFLPNRLLTNWMSSLRM